MTSARPGVGDRGDHPGVLLGDRLRTVHDDDADLGALDGAGGAQARVVLVARRLLDPLADAGGVDEPPHPTAELDELVDGVDGGAGHVVHDDPVGLGQLVEQRRLADVGPADDGDAAGSADLAVRLGGRFGQCREDRVEHVAGAAAVQRGDRERLAETEVPQRRGLGLGALVVDLVGGEHDGLAGAAQDLHDGLVGVGDADGGVDHEQRRVGDGDGDLGLRGDPLGEAAGVGVPAAGVDDGERAGRSRWRRRRPGRESRRGRPARPPRGGRSSG